nr:uncharacterized protein CTRU02_03802 [Colletotrichum truncatum]KAF6796824.1 hypothetical protein CTRU02_03802 [Colletotrichum truncatum]
MPTPVHLIPTAPLSSLCTSLSSHPKLVISLNGKDLSSNPPYNSIFFTMSASNLTSRPPFSSLPLDPNGPPGNAWGLYGKDDKLGALNLLTPAVVAAAAASEIRTGDRVSLDWSLNNPSQPSFDRAPFESKLVNRTKIDGEGRTVNDDILHFNTQCSSQWDGFRHYGYQKAKRYYNNTTQEDLDNPENIGIDGE